MKNILTGLMLSISLFVVVACGSNSSSNTTVEEPTSVEPPRAAINIAGTSKFGQRAELQAYGENPLISSTTINEQGRFTFNDIEIVNDTIYEVRTCVENGLCLKSLMRGVDIKAENEVYVTALTDLVFAMANNQSSERLGQNNFLESQATSLIKSDINGDSAISYSDVLAWTETGGFFDNLNINQNKLTNYIVNVANNERSYGSIFTVNPPLVMGDFRKNVGEEFNFQLTNLPEGISYKYYLMNSEYTNNPLVLNRAGAYNLTFNIIDETEVLYQFTREIVVSNQLTVKEENLLSLDVSDQKIVVLPSDNLSLAGIEVLVKQASTTTGTTLTVAKEDIDAIANTEAVALSSVISLGPNGTVFTEPVEVKIPFDKDGIEPEDIASLQIIRESDGVVDYIIPNSIDYDNGFAYFKTDHFSLFGLFSRKSGFSALSLQEQKNYISRMVSSFGVDQKTTSEWEAILDYEYTEDSITLYDYTEAYFYSETLFNAHQAGGIGAALDIAFPNGNALDNSIENWNQALKGLEKFEHYYTNAISKFGEGEQFFKLLGLLVDASEIYDATTQTNDVLYSPFAPLRMGDQLFLEFRSIFAKQKETILDINSEQGCDFVTVEEVGSEEGYQNFQYVCRLIQNFAQDKDEQNANILDLVEGIEREFEIIEDEDFPHIAVKLNSINSAQVSENTVKQTREISSGDPLVLKLDITSYGIRDFDRGNLQVDLISLEDESVQLRADWRSSSQVAVFDVSTLRGLQQFKIKVLDPVSETFFEYFLINVDIRDALEISSVSTLGTGSIYHGQRLVVEFNQNVNSDSIKEAVIFTGNQTYEYGNGWDFTLDNQVSFFGGNVTGQRAEFSFSFEQFDTYVLSLEAVEAEQANILPLNTDEASIIFEYGIGSGQNVFVYDFRERNSENEYRINLNGYLARGGNNSLTVEISGGETFEFDLNEAIASRLANPGAPGNLTFPSGIVGADYSLVVNEWNDFYIIDILLNIVNRTSSQYSGNVKISLCASSNDCSVQDKYLSLNAEN